LLEPHRVKNVIFDVGGVLLHCFSNMPTGIYGTLRERLYFWRHFDGIVFHSAVQVESELRSLG
jgi:FMN phosphatase YigB (HAD superfamily)